MSTSSLNSFNAYRDEIVDSALRKCGVTSITSANRTDATLALNMIIKDLSLNYGVRLWKTEWKTKIFSAASEVTGTDSNVYTCIKSHTSAAGNRPITGSDYEHYWVKRGTTGGVWATSTAYASVGDFAPDTDVVAIDKAFWRFNDYDLPIDIISRQEYFDETDKTQTSRPTGLWLNRFADGTPHIYLNNQLEDLNYVLHYLQVVQMEDMTFGSNTADIPTRWLRALTFMLAADLSFEFDVPVEKRIGLKREAENLAKMARSGDIERTSRSFIRPAY